MRWYQGRVAQDRGPREHLGEETLRRRTEEGRRGNAEEEGVGSWGERAGGRS